MRPPDETVLRAFGIRKEVVAQLLGGGQGTSFLVDDLVFKPADNTPGVAEWAAEVFAKIEQDGFRVAKPRATLGGGWVFGGWVASEWIEGEHDHGECWKAVIEVARRFHQATKDLRKPVMLSQRTDAWARGDRVAWGEEPGFGNPEQQRILQKLLGLLRGELAAESQVIHGDLTSNILFAPGLEPAVIDFSPYWRPEAFSEAIILADSIGWKGASYGCLDLLGEVGEATDLIIRAVLFRVAATVGNEGHRSGRVEAVMAGYSPLIQHLTGVRV